MLRNRLRHKVGAGLAILAVIGIATPSTAVNAASAYESESTSHDAFDESLGQARAELLDAATAHNVALLVEADIANYNGNIDDALIARLVDEELPVGRENAEKWVSSFDDLSLPLAKILRANECLDEKHGCKDPEYCVFGGKRASCMVTSCGDGACKACLDVFGDLRKLAVKGWCAYTCQQGTAIPGIKLVLQIRILGEMSACLPLTTPVP